MQRLGYVMFLCLMGSRHQVIHLTFKLANMAYCSVEEPPTPSFSQLSESPPKTHLMGHLGQPAPIQNLVTLLGNVNRPEVAELVLSPSPLARN